MSIKTNSLFIALLILLGFYPIVQVLGQTSFVTTRHLEFSRSGWDTSTPRDYTPGGSLLEGDFEFVLNLTISSYDKNVTISEKAGSSQNYMQIEVGEVSEDFYLDSPFYIYNNNRSGTARWWFYWLDSSSLDSNMHFDLPLEDGGKFFLNSLLYQEGNWVGNKTLLIDSPLPIRVTQTADKWVLSGSDTYNTTDNFLVNRSLLFKYDTDGYLLLLEGDTCIAHGIYFYKHHFSWQREIKLITDIPLESNPFTASSSKSISILVFAPLVGLIFLTLLRYRHKKNKSRF